MAGILTWARTHMPPPVGPRGPAPRLVDDVPIDHRDLPLRVGSRRSTLSWAPVLAFNRGVGSKATHGFDASSPIDGPPSAAPARRVARLGDPACLGASRERRCFGENFPGLIHP